MNKKNISIAIVIILHLVGALGTVYPAFSSFFVQLTPLNLFISSIILLITDDNNKNKLVSMLILTAVVGYLAEVIGVHTGLIFGGYAYGNTLGFKLFDVPLIIGLNWFILTYITYHFFLKIKDNMAAAVLGAGLMTLIDVIIEPVAIDLSYWSWDEVNVPIQNYIGWFVISLILHLIIRNRFKSHVFNDLTIYLFLGQIFYFLVVFIFY